MNDNGTFRKKKGFTIAGNTVIRDSTLSLKAKGLYLLIMSYITLESLILTKSFLQAKCTEGAKAFCSAWDELKKHGYLKLYMKPSKVGWQVEYDLLEEPELGAHTFYLASDGSISKTNITRNRTNQKELDLSQHYPPYGTNAQGLCVESSNAQGTCDNGGNNIKLENKTLDKISCNTQSIRQFNYEGSQGLSEEEIRDIVQNDFCVEKIIPYHYKTDEKKMLVAIRILADWYDRTPQTFQKELEKDTFDLLVDYLAEMACADGVQKYKGSAVTYSKVIDKINKCVNRDGSLYEFTVEAIDDYVSAAKKKPIGDTENYFKSIIWNSLLTYCVKSGSFFERTFNN